MAHQLRTNDSMLAVGEKPWHGLGVTLPTPPATGEEALRIAGLDWTVSREPLFLGTGQRAVIDGAVSRSNDGQYAAIVLDSDEPGFKEVLGIVGPSYEPYQNHQMAELFNPLIQDGRVTIETCGSLFGKRRVWMLAKFTREDMEIEKGDSVASYLLAAHGHDGGFAMRFGYTPVRVVCNNTLSFACEDHRSHLVKCLHTKNLEENLEVLRDSMVEAEEMFALAADQYRLLASRGVSRADLREYARIIIEADKDDKEWTTGQKDKIGTIVGAAMEGRGNSGKNWWHAYNAVTEWVSWSKGSKKDNRLDSAWFGEGKRVSERALDLALEMSA
ncbi:MAG: DUF932 domain-containing protein [bacterium]|nr:DUF932 domain-containing protein [bacterium]